MFVISFNDIKHGLLHEIQTQDTWTLLHEKQSPNSPVTRTQTNITLSGKLYKMGAI